MTRPKKSLGQNFLIDKNIIEKIIKYARLKEDDIVIEIGAGHGELTIPLSGHVSQVFAIEKDPGLCHKLKKRMGEERIRNIKVIRGDILKLDLREIDDFPKKPIVMGNIPYNISSLILKRLISSKEIIEKAILMFQLEYAKRLVASPGTKEYGSLTLFVSYHATVKELFSVSRNVFFPRPSVDSMVVEIIFDKKYPESDEAIFRFVVNAAFSHRRKNILNSLFEYMKGSGIRKEEVREFLLSSNINPELRAENLSIEDFLRLSEKMKKYLPKEKLE